MANEPRQRGLSIWQLLKYGIYGLIAVIVIYNFFSPDSSPEAKQDYVEETLQDPTQGIIAHIKEQEENLFRITDEELIDNRDDSRIIATYMNETVDTFTIDEIQLMEADDPKRSTLRTIAMAGMIGYMVGRPMNSGVARSAYADDRTFNKSNTSGRSQLSSTSRTKTVRKPVSKSGFGSRKSAKSYGGIVGC